MPALADLFRTYYLSGEGTVDFASIRLHYAGADQACRALNARAFTVGSDIYFADGAFNPHTRAGLWLLAHEVAHVVQQSAGEVSAPGSFPAHPVAPAGTQDERAADAAAEAFIGGRSFVFGARRPRLVVGRPRPVQRFMAWEHALLGDLAPGEIQALAARGPARSRGGGGAEQILAYCALLEKLGRDPRGVDEERLRAQHIGLETMRLPGSGLVVTLGELNILPDYLGHPGEIETAPAAFLEPLIQSVRGWSIAELLRSAGRRRPRRRLPGSLRYPLLGGLAESAEVVAVSTLGKRCGFAPVNQYSSVLARNAAHFAPFSWYRWHSFHLMSRAMIQRSATTGAADRESLRRRARIYAGYADHFLQDSFAAGHLINKTLVMQWYIEWLAESGVSYPDRDVLAAMTVARQPLLHGPHHYRRGHARLGEGTAGRIGGVPRPPWDPQDMADAPTMEDRIAVSGLIGGSHREERAAYAAYLTMLSSATMQLAAKVAHDYLNERSVVVSSGPHGPRFRLHGDHALLAGGDGAWRAAQAAAASRQAVSDLLRHGETEVSSWEIFESFPDHVEQDGRMITLEEWHGSGLRELCFRELFGRWSTRAMRLLISRAARQLGTPAAGGLRGTQRQGAAHDDPGPAAARVVRRERHVREAHPLVKRDGSRVLRAGEGLQRGRAALGCGGGECLVQPPAQSDSPGSPSRARSIVTSFTAGARPAGPCEPARRRRWPAHAGSSRPTRRRRDRTTAR